MNDIVRMDNDSVRDVVNARDRFEPLRQARSEARHSYGGSMKFEARGDVEYLIRRPYGSASKKSCGRRRPETERILENFLAGKKRVRDRISSLRRQLAHMAPILRYRGLGRVPLIAARILRRVDELGWLGTSLTVIGTNALYAYEAKAAVRIEAGLLATGDIDVLYDARRRLVMSGEVVGKGLVGASRTVDRSFRKTASGSYRVANRDGYLVDLIEPLDHDRRTGEPVGSSGRPFRHHDR